jgi:hypothetical protein
MWGPVQSPAQQQQVLQSSQAIPNQLQAQALALAARLSPNMNAQRNSFGAAPSGINMGQPHGNPLVPKNPWAGGQTGGGIPPATQNLPGYFGGTSAMLGRYTTPGNGAALG